VLGLYGAKDASIPQDTVETMRQALRAANATAEIVVYPEADHAFNADYRASYHEESAKDGWQRMLAWFAQYGGKRVIHKRRHTDGVFSYPPQHFIFLPLPQGHGSFRERVFDGFRSSSASHGIIAASGYPASSNC
jgi:hypothetical protein